MARHSSIRSTMSEQLDYRNEHLFLNAGMSASPSDMVGSTPEVSVSSNIAAPPPRDWGVGFNLPTASHGHAASELV